MSDQQPTITNDLDVIDDGDNLSCLSCDVLGRCSSSVTSSSGASSTYAVPVPCDNSGLVSIDSVVSEKVQLKNDSTPLPLNEDVPGEDDFKYGQSADGWDHPVPPEAEMEQLKGSSTVDALSNRDEAGNSLNDCENWMSPDLNQRADCNVPPLPDSRFYSHVTQHIPESVADLSSDGEAVQGRFARRSKQSFEPSKSLELRPYQEEISRSACDGNNDLILLPTGTGKTFVAISIIRHHLQRRVGEPCKVVYFVEHVDLARQQIAKIKVYVQPEYAEQCESITGPDNLSPSQLKKKVLDPDIKVLVVTPAIIENYFKSSETAGVSDFTLLIFDECHHAKKHHLYRQLLLKVAATRFQLEPMTVVASGHEVTSAEPSGSPNRAQHLPQLVGMTATTGVGNSKSVTTAMKFIIGICALFDLKQPPSRVVEYVNQLEAAINHPDEETIELGETVDPTSEMIQSEFMKPIEATVKEKGSVVQAQLNREIIFPADRRSQRYQQYSNELKGIFQTLNDDSENVVYCTLALEYLENYSQTLNVINVLNGSAGVNFLKNKFKDSHFHSHDLLWHPYIGNLPNLERVSQEAEVHPNLETLVEKLESIFAKAPASQVMVLVKERYVCHYLASELEARNRTTFHPTPYTSNEAKTEGGMTLEEKDSALDGFRKGRFNILVATSLAEEGLDIPECNATIRYLYVRDMIAKIQAKGRTRKSGGSFVSIIDRRLHNLDKKHDYKRNLMIECLRKLQGEKQDSLEVAVESDAAMDEEDTYRRVRNELQEGEFDFQSMLNESNEVLVKAAEEYLKDNAMPAAEGLEQPGVVKCSTCKTELGDLADVRRFIDLFLILDETLHERITPDVLSGNNEILKHGMVAYCQLRCLRKISGQGVGLPKNCSQHVANLVKVDGVQLAIWNIQNVVIEDGNGTLTKFMKWKEVRDKYRIKEITIESEEWNSNKISKQFRINNMR